MTIRRPSFYSFLLFFFLLPVLALGKGDSSSYRERIPSEESMKELRKEDPYRRYLEHEKKEDLGERSLLAQIRTFIDEYLFSPAENVLGSRKLLNYILMVIGVGVVVAYFVRNEIASVLRKGAAKSAPESTPFTSFDIEEEGPLRKARNAEKKGAFIEALRWRYIYIVQCLGEKGLIRKSAHRTDREYLSDLRGTGFEASFQRLSDFFQLVHYGDRPIGERDYEDWKEDFKELERRVKQYEG